LPRDERQRAGMNIEHEQPGSRCGVQNANERRRDD
jgi:hypothetical protein